MRAKNRSRLKAPKRHGSFSESAGVSEERTEIVWDGIAMHPSALAHYKRPEIALVANGAAADRSAVRRIEGRNLKLLRPVVHQSICAIFHALPALPSVDNRDGCQVSVAALQRSATASPQVFLAHFHLEPHTTRPDAAG
jgi:hypothetical protein